MQKDKSVNRYALKITLPYLVASGLWIIFSDRFIAGLADDIQNLTALQTYKGWFFITMSALMVYLISRRYLERIRQTATSLQESRVVLSETQRVMATLHANLPGFAYRCSADCDRVIHFVSNSCLAVTGYTSDQLVGGLTLHRHLILPGDRDMVNEAIESSVAHAAPYQLEYRIRHEDASVRWIWEQGCGVFSADGTLVALEGYVSDISEQKHLQEQLRNAERLEHIGQAASTIIHDLKNPMQVILGHVELLRLERDKADTDRYLDTIEHQVQTMLSMSRELLDYARGEISFVFTPINVRDMLERLVETYRPTFSQLGIGLSFTWRQETDTSPVLDLDGERMGRALMNLIGNARDALKDQGQIRVRAWAAPESLSIEIQDDGPGIPSHIRDRLFEAFVTHGKSGGTGLGLAIARKIVESHHGKITCSSAPGSGTTFTIILPRTRTSASSRLLEAADAVPR
ncbi:MAG: PAS domain-containing sensor histidine kinase [candidate division Zixibacteria bacterium]|nr:PAS domain-containing sensor histidine kinase [candidate division Zixibacteria bacterium]